VGDAFSEFSDLLSKVEKASEGRKLGQNFRLRAARYAVFCEAAKLRMQKLAGVKDVPAPPPAPKDTPPKVLSLFEEGADDA
jgi:hypothetical protein